MFDSEDGISTELAVIRRAAHGSYSSPSEVATFKWAYCDGKHESGRCVQVMAILVMLCLSL